MKSCKEVTLITAIDSAIASDTPFLQLQRKVMHRSHFGSRGRWKPPRGGQTGQPPRYPTKPWRCCAFPCCCCLVQLSHWAAGWWRTVVWITSAVKAGFPRWTPSPKKATLMTNAAIGPVPCTPVPRSMRWTGKIKSGLQRMRIRVACHCVSVTRATEVMKQIHSNKTKHTYQAKLTPPAV